MLHDIGTTYEAVHATKLSFEFWGGIKALKVLQDELAGEARASQEQAESVAEAIIRHQDIVEKGSITTIGRLLQLATIFGRFDGEVIPTLNVADASNRQHRKS